jgi:biofilm PGA synthesis N-glycosyltransferase PgaC
MGPQVIHDATNTLLNFTFYYPLFMAYVWMIGALNYYFRFERGIAVADLPPGPPFVEPVSIVIPMRNEAQHARETVAYALAIDYPTFEVLAVNDGSTDETGTILDELARGEPRLRVVHLAQNQGKAIALEMGALVAKHEFLVCIDGDAILHPRSVRWMMRHFAYARVAAVTGNPRIRTRSSLLGKIQVGEFSAIVGLIKRAQRTYGRVFTVSGVAAAFRKAALHDVGYWTPDMLAEDIDVTWRMQIRHWDVRYEPLASIWILMQETFRGLWNQRLRWAMGGFQVVLKYAGDIRHWGSRRMWGIFVEFLLSITWAYSMLLITTLWLLGLVLPLPSYVRIASPVPGWAGVVIGTTCLLQIAVSLFLDRRYDYRLGRIYFWMIWYPLAFWIVSALTTVVAVPKILMRKRNARAIWVSPDRGINSDRGINPDRGASPDKGLSRP